MKLPAIIPTPPPINQPHINFFGKKIKSEDWNEFGVKFARFLDYLIVGYAILLVLYTMTSYLSYSHH